MFILATKLILTPALIGLVSLAGRRWGPTVSGWLIGLPLTSAPVALFLALSHGTAFASAASVGILGGTISQVAFSLAYSWSARRFRWPLAVTLSGFTFLLSTAALQRLNTPLLPLYALVLLSLVTGLFLIPNDSGVTLATSKPPRWDIPARMIVATSFVVLLTGAAPTLGPLLTGLLSPLPLYAATLAVFAHHFDGAMPAAGVLRGMLLGLFSFANFFLVLALLLEPAGIAVAFGVAIVVALATQGCSLLIVRRATFAAM